jgi:hypothetical protein
MSGKPTLLQVRRWAWAAILLWLFAVQACTTGPEPPAATLPPTTAILTVHLAGELNLLRPVMASCAAEIHGAGLLVFEAPVPVLPDGAGEMTLWFGDPPPADLQAALLGYDEIVLAAPAAADRGPLSDSEVRSLFGGKAPADWGVVELWLPQPGQAAREVLDRFTAGAGYPPEAFLAPTPAAMIDALSGNPDAIGVVPAAWLTGELAIAYSLEELPVLALTDRIPTGIARELIGCLQVNPVYGE